jgi:hypothetical protein
MITHQQQPTKTSCGITCVAMLTGAEFEHVYRTIQLVRQPIHSNRKHRTSAYELRGALQLYGYTLLDCVQVKKSTELPSDAFGLLRVHRMRSSGSYRKGWHWCAIEGDNVHDPNMFDDIDVYSFFDCDTTTHKIFYYPIKKRSV